MGSRRWCMTYGRGGQRVIYDWLRRFWIDRRGWLGGRARRLRFIVVNIYVHRYKLRFSDGCSGGVRQFPPFRKVRGKDGAPALGVLRLRPG
jgi:hypothetical protein